MAKQHIKFDEEITGMIKVLCDKHQLSVEDLFIKLIIDEFSRVGGKLLNK